MRTSSGNTAQKKHIISSTPITQNETSSGIESFFSTPRTKSAWLRLNQSKIIKKKSLIQ
jgi:hypothetical protein